MRRRRLFWQIFPPYLYLTAIPLLAVGWYTGHRIDAFYRLHLAGELEHKARLAGLQLVRNGGLPPPSEVDALCDRIGPPTRTRYTVIAPDGTVIGDSDGTAAEMENHADRPEVVAAKRTGVGIATRHSATLGKDMMYVGHALRANDDLLAVVRTAVPLTDIQTALDAVSKSIALTLGAIALVAAAVALVVARRIASPIESMRHGAERLAAGDADFQLASPRCEELASLAASINTLATSLNNRIRTIAEQRNERDAVFSSMEEGVLAIDADEHILHANQALVRILGLDADAERGTPVRKLVRNPELFELVGNSLSSDTPVAADITLWTHAEKVLRGHGTPLHDAEGHRIGAVIVLEDVTEIRRLEKVRRDFVTNVSHELRTPVTSIRGFVETLRDGAADEREQRDRFLSIIERQAQNLEAIIDDLLTLASLESDEAHDRISTAPNRVADVLQLAADTCAEFAARKGVELDVQCPTDLEAPLHVGLLEQAVTNLIHNAIQYSVEDQTVTVVGRKGNGDVHILVRDQGCGIQAQHLERIFERFYRIDKGRSREAGGTGLGLAIVKHIAHAHGGDVRVESHPGRGSTFTIVLPV